MKKFLKAIPIPIAGVMLGLAALGNPLQSYSEGIRLFLGALAAIIWVLLVLKVIVCWPGVKAAMDDPVVASVSGTFPMVITAIAAKQSMACLGKLGTPAPWLNPVVLVETIIAAVLVIYALVRYLMALTKSVKTPA